MNGYGMGMIGAVLLMSIGCGGGGGIAPADLPVELEKALCEQMVACGSMPDIESCRDSVFVAEGPGAEQLIADIEAGLIDYDEDAAEDCLDLFRNASCEFSLIEPVDGDVCDRVLIGRVDIGGECFSGDHCAGDAECDVSACGPEECCAGVCVAAEPVPPEAEIGQDCSETTCVSGAYCRTDPETFNRICAARSGEGQACEDFDACTRGLLCDLDLATGTGTCIQPPREGDSCNPDALFIACARVDNFCDPVDSICKKRLEPGAACDVETNHCAGYAFCDGTTCQARPVEGESCVVDSSNPCLGDLDCVGTTCAAPAFEEVCNSENAG